MDSQWLKTQFAANPDKTKAGLAVAIGLEPPAVSKILNGTRQIKAQEYILMREFFGLPNDGDAPLRKTPPRLQIQPLDGMDGFGEGSRPAAEWAIPAGLLRPEGQGQSRIFQVYDDAMAPDFQKGEHVLVDGVDRKPSPPGAFIVSDGYGHMLRDCEYAGNKDSGDVRISGRKKSFQSQILKRDEFIIIGRVIAKLQLL